MKLNRRDFLKLSGAGVCAAAVLSSYTARIAMAAGGNFPLESTKAVLHDATKCIGCKVCEQACRKSNELLAKPNTSPQLSASTWTIIHSEEVEVDGKLQRIFTKWQCMHCQHPACVSACPVGALQKTAYGPVTYDEGKCIGCRYCMVACPFSIPKYEWEEPTPWVRKCTFCADRLSEGLEPACVAACPTGALEFGDREALIAEAKKRISVTPDKYVNRIYGEKEGGGTSWLYLSPVPFDKLGFPTLDSDLVIGNVERAMSAVPPVLLGVAIALSGFHWIIQRRQKMGQATAVEDEKQGMETD